MELPDLSALTLNARTEDAQSTELLDSWAHPTNPATSLLLDYEVSFATFNPRETERIAGIPYALQRLWRHRGHLGFRPRNATARYTSLELAELCVRYCLSICSLPPAKSMELGRSAARNVLLAAISLGKGAVEIVGSPAEADRLLDEFRHEPKFAAALCGAEWNVGARYLWSADGKKFLFANLEEFRLLTNKHDFLMLIDLVAMGTRIASDAKRPLVTVACRGSSGGVVTSRQTSGLHAVPKW